MNGQTETSGQGPWTDQEEAQREHWATVGRWIAWPAYLVLLSVASQVCYAIDVRPPYQALILFGAAIILSGSTLGRAAWMWHVRRLPIAPEGWQDGTRARIAIVMTTGFGVLFLVLAKLMSGNAGPPSIFDLPNLALLALAIHSWRRARTQPSGRMRSQTVALLAVALIGARCVIIETVLPGATRAMEQPPTLSDLAHG